MATIRKRNGKWHVQIRLKGAKPATKTFHLKSDAAAWVRNEESRIQRGLPSEAAPNLRVTLAALMERYRDTVTVRKKSRYNETLLVNRLLKLPFTQQAAIEVIALTFSQYRDERAKVLKASPLNHELRLFSQVYTYAKTEWGIEIENPLRGIKRAKADVPRARRLEEGEWAALVAAARKCRNSDILAVIKFAVATAMRRGEILAAQWEHVDWKKRTLHIPVTKTGHSRTIALTETALAILGEQFIKHPARPFPVTTNAFKLAWGRVVQRAKLRDLHFHDFRHEAVSRFFEIGLTMPEVASISGHRDPRMLFRYTHLRAEDVSAKLSALQRNPAR